jgi:hypothetical protein
VETVNAKLDDHKVKIRLHSGEVHTVRSARFVGDQCTWLAKSKEQDWWVAWNAGPDAVAEPDTVAVPVSSIKSIAWKDHGRGAMYGLVAGLVFAAVMSAGSGEDDYGMGALVGIASFPLCVAVGWIGGLWTGYAIDESCESWAGDEPPGQPLDQDWGGLDGAEN